MSRQQTRPTRDDHELDAFREVLNAMFYVDRTGCQWRALPRDFPAWPTVWSYFRTWRNDGTWQRIHATLRAQVPPFDLSAIAVPRISGHFADTSS